MLITVLKIFSFMDVLDHFFLLYLINDLPGGFFLS